MSKREVIYVAVTWDKSSNPVPIILAAGHSRAEVFAVAHQAIFVGVGIDKGFEHRSLRVYSRTELKRTWGVDWDEYDPDTAERGPSYTYTG